MKRFPFQRATSGKQRGAALGTGGDHAARTGKVPPRYLQWGGWMPRCPEREVLRCQERGSCRSHPGKQLCNRYCQIAVLPSLLFAKSACRIDKPIGLSSLSYCQARRKRGVPSFLPVYLRCNYLGTWYFWKGITANCLQLARVRRSVFLRRPKNRRFRKMCL